MKNNKKTALVLSGGGAKGAFQAGALQVLKEAGYKYDVIGGISVGSLNGAMIATDQFEQLMRIWQNITPQQVYTEQSLLGMARRYLQYKIGLGKPPVSKYNNGPLRKLMEEQLLGKEASTVFLFGFVELETGEYIEAAISDNSVINEMDVNRMLASTAIPVVFNPVKVAGHKWVDGGVRNISPIRLPLLFNPDQMIIIPTQPVDAEPGHKEVRDIIQIAERTIYIMLDEIFHEDIDRFLTINNLILQAEAAGIELKRKNGQPYKYIKPLIIAPKEPLGSALNFDNANVNKLMELGRKRAREVLNQGVEAV